MKTQRIEDGTRSADIPVRSNLLAYPRATLAVEQTEPACGCDRVAQEGSSHAPADRNVCAPGLRRREFLLKGALATAGVALSWPGANHATAAGFASLPIVVFSKIYQELKLSLEESATMTAEAGLDGVDSPLRPGGEILPERAENDLPRYVEILKSQKLQLPLLTTAITSPDSPRAEQILNVAKKLGIKYYRIGFFTPKKNVPFERQAAEIRSMLKDLAALNKQVGITGLFQNHSGSIGANLSETKQLLEGLDPAQLGLAFDLGHALLVHGKGWREHYEALKSKLKVAYVKDAEKGKGWTRFGEGQFARTGYFKLLRDLGYNAPFSLHIEFDWSDKGKNKTRSALLKVLKESTDALRAWLKQA